MMKKNYKNDSFEFLGMMIAGTLCLLSCVSLWGKDAKEVTACSQLGTEIVWRPFAPKNPVTGLQGNYAVQFTRKDRLLLTASNGFFDSGLRAKGEHPIDEKQDNQYIVPSFATITGWEKKDVKARWYIWIGRSGSLILQTGGCVPTKGTFTFSISPFDGEKCGKELIGYASLQKEPPKSIRVAKGAYQITIQGSGQALGDIELFGSAVNSSSGVLRARWRPAAAHNGYGFSNQKKEPSDLWVVTMKSVAPVTSYSPVTTPFGYYGTTFQEDGTSSGRCNFSLWSGVNNPPTRWSHLLAAGSPQAVFGDFHHEGCGVKLRGNWAPMVGYREITLALRRESHPPFTTYFSYFYDYQQKRWRLYAAGNKLTARKDQFPLYPNSFVEQPGPPQFQRSGDLRRSILRKGWILSKEGEWKPLDTQFYSGKGMANKSWTAGQDGWLEIGMGGMVYYPYTNRHASVSVDRSKEKLPEFLSPSAKEQLMALPAKFGKRSYQEKDAGVVTLTLNMLHAGKNAKATVYYALEDCMTFQHDMRYKDHPNPYWEKSISIPVLKDGDTTVQIPDLKADTKYFVRILIQNDDGLCWSETTDSFLTKKR